MEQNKYKSYGEVYDVPFIDDINSTNTFYINCQNKTNDHIFLTIPYNNIYIEILSSDDENDDEQFEDYNFLSKNVQKLVNMNSNSCITESHKYGANKIGQSYEHTSETSDNYITDDSQFYDSFIGSNDSLETSVYDEDVDLYNSDDKISKTVHFSNDQKSMDTYNEYGSSLETMYDELICGPSNQLGKSTGKSAKSKDDNNYTHLKDPNKYYNYNYKATFRIMFCCLNTNAVLTRDMHETHKKRNITRYASLDNDLIYLEMNNSYGELAVPKCDPYNFVDDYFLDMEISEYLMFDSFLNLDNLFSANLSPYCTKFSNAQQDKCTEKKYADQSLSLENNELSTSSMDTSEWTLIKEPNDNFMIDDFDSNHFTPNAQSTELRPRFKKKLNRNDTSENDNIMCEDADTLENSLINRRAKPKKNSNFHWWAYMTFGVALAAAGIAIVYLMKKCKGAPSLMKKGDT